MENNKEEIKENELLTEKVNEQQNKKDDEPVNESKKDVEPVNESKNDVENKVVNEFLTLLIKKISEDKQFIDTINLDKKSLDVIYFIFNRHPKILENICNDIKNITNDKVISVNDIPSIILLCKDIFNLYSESNNIKLTKIEIIDFIKNLLIILIKSDLIKINDNEKELIIDLINLSIKLLETKINLRKTCVLKFW